MNYEAGIKKFDKEISRVIVLCKDLQKELDDLQSQMVGVDNNFSAKLLSNEKISIFVRQYSEIVRSYESACKEFSKLDPILEKLMYVEGDAKDLIDDATRVMDEAQTSISFGTSFEDSSSFIFEVLAPTLSRIVEVGNAIVEKARETLEPNLQNNKQSKMFDVFGVIFFWLMFTAGILMISVGFFAKKSNFLKFGAILCVSASAIIFLIKSDKWPNRNSD